AAGLRHHGERARLERRELQRAAESDARVVLQVHDAEAVGPYHAHAGAARRGDELRLQRLSLTAHLAETGGEHERIRNPRLAALLDHARHVWRLQRDERDVARLRN